MRYSVSCWEQRAGHHPTDHFFLRLMCDDLASFLDLLAYRTKRRLRSLPSFFRIRIRIPNRFIRDHLGGRNVYDSNRTIFRGYKSATMRNGKPHLISYEEMIKFHKGVATGLEEIKMGFVPSKIGTHSMRVTFATNICNQGYSDVVIMAEGRCESSAFLKIYPSLLF
jgi:hypothetical protein